MTNFEKYEDLIIKEGLCGVSDLSNSRCFYDKKCSECREDIIKWLKEDYEEKIDWGNVAVDTPVIVSLDGSEWYRRYFAKVENNKVYTFADGATSWSQDGIISWEYARLTK